MREPGAARQTKARNNRVQAINCSWTPEEDDKLRELVVQHGTKDWVLISQLLGGCRKSKQVRERFINHVDPSVRKDPWTEEEDRLIATLQAKLGNSWVQIARYIPGRSDNSVKNRWNSSIKKRLQSGELKPGAMPRSHVHAHAHRSRPAKRGRYASRSRAPASGSDEDEEDDSEEEQEEEDGEEEEDNEEDEEDEDESPAPMNDDEAAAPAPAPSPPPQASSRPPPQASSSAGAGAGGQSEEEEEEEGAAIACGSDEALQAPRPRLKLARDSRSALAPLAPAPAPPHHQLYPPQQLAQQLAQPQPQQVQVQRPQATRLQFVTVAVLVPSAIKEEEEEDGCSDAGLGGGAAACWPVSVVEPEGIRFAGEGLEDDMDMGMGLGMGLPASCGVEPGALPGDFGAASAIPCIDPLSMQLSWLLASSPPPHGGHQGHYSQLQAPSSCFLSAQDPAASAAPFSFF
eukprot:tig00021179_g19295.t1